MPPAAESVADFVREVTGCGARGGSCMATSKTQCVLYDCGSWTTEMHNRVVRQFPGCSITVSVLDSSLTGFVVLFDSGDPETWMWGLFLLLVVVSSLAIATSHVYACADLDLEPWPNFTRS